ncbi:MAG: ArsR/SmtB family transcription factor [archaeon]
MNRGPYEGFFKNLGNKTRFKIIRTLQEKPKSVMEIAEDIGMEQSAVSHHLKQLKECKLIQLEVEGRKRIYSLSETVKPVLEAAKRHKIKYCLNGCPYKGGE